MATRSFVRIPRSRECAHRDHSSSFSNSLSVNLPTSSGKHAASCSNINSLRAGRIVFVQIKRFRSSSRNHNVLIRLHRSNKHHRIVSKNFSSDPKQSPPHPASSHAGDEVRHVTKSSHAEYSEYHPHHAHDLQSDPNNSSFWGKFGFESGTLAAGITVSGLMGGLTGGLAGTGGGIVMIPLLRHLTRLTTHEIAGASLSAVVGGTLVASFAYAQQSGMVCLPIVLTTGLFAVLSSALGVKLAPAVSNRLLTSLISMFLFASIVPIYDKIKKNDAKKRSKNAIESGGNENGNDTHDTSQIETNGVKMDWNAEMKIFMQNPVSWMAHHYEYVILGCAAGVLTGLMGLGGGVVMTSYLAGYSNLTQYEVIGTSLMCLLPQSIIASLLHARHGTVSLPVSITLASCHAVGMFAATQVTLDIDEKYLQVGLCCLLLASGASMARNAAMLWRAGDAPKSVVLAVKNVKASTKT